MEHRFTAALWVCFLLGYLQAHPVCPGEDDLRLCSLQQHVRCVTVTFASPTNVNVSCFDAAMHHFKEELYRARASCEAGQEYINDTLETLEDRFPSTNFTNCTLDTKESEFKVFVKYLENFIQSVNTKSRT